MVSGLAGAAVGAIIGGAISWMLARQAASETLRRDDAERHDREKALVRTVLMKVQNTLNRLYSTCISITETMEHANANGARDGMLWMKMQPVIGTSAPPKFEPDELAQMMRMDVKIANDLMLMEAKAEAFYLSLEIYNVRRLDFTDRLPVDNVDGAMRHMVFTAELQRATLPRATELSNLARQLLDSLAEDLPFARALCDRIPTAWTKYFGLDKQTPRLDFSALDERMARFLQLHKDDRSMPPG